MKNTRRSGVWCVSGGSSTHAAACEVGGHDEGSGSGSIGDDSLVEQAVAVEPAVGRISTAPLSNLGPRTAEPHGLDSGGRLLDDADDFLDMERCEAIAWLAADGEVLLERGGAPGFAGSSAYAVRLAQLAGEMLSLGSFVALECRDASCSRLAYQDGQGGLVACVPGDPEVATALRRRLRLLGV